MSAPFVSPSKFMMGVKIADEIKSMSLLEIAQRLRYESANNGNLNWNDTEPEKCWYRALTIELGNRLYSKLDAKEWGDWQDEFCCLLTGIAGYDDHWAFSAGRMFGIEADHWDALEAFLEKEQASEVKSL